MTVNHYEYPKVVEILKGFLKALKDNLIIYENDLILYYNQEEVSSSFFITLGKKLRDYCYSEEQSMEIIEYMSLMAMALESNLISAGMTAKNPTWYIYISKVKYGYTEGSSDTSDKFIPPSENRLDEAQVLEAAKEKEKLLQIKGS